MWIYSPAAGGLQRAQQPIAPQIMVSLYQGSVSFRFRVLRHPDKGHADGARDRDRHVALILQISLIKSAQSPALDCPLDQAEPTMDWSSSINADAR
jgi:hypothetical protein